MGLGPLQLMESVLVSITRPQTLSLVLIVGLILVMSRIMEENGHMNRLVESFTRLSKDGRTTSSVMSALIGLLPMPGGALFSAPMVETSLCKHPVTCEQKTILNYWFRHIWEYWWPLYPGVVLAVALLEVDTWLFMAIMAPMTLFSVIAGVIFILRPIEKIEGQERGGLSWQDVKEFLWEIMPILVVVFVILALAGVMGILGRFGFHMKIAGAYSILPGLVAATAWVCAVNHVSYGQFRSAVMDKKILPILLMIVAIMVFKGTLTESQAVVQIRNELMAYKIPVILIIVIMPFLSGFITGIAVGFVGTSFPLIIPMFQTNHVLDYMSFVALAYAFGYMGMMFSPVHLCILVSKDYFNAGLLNSYRHLIMPALTVMLAAVVFFFILRIL
jgi:integral membrane protein (TIGR00529 family)